MRTSAGFRGGNHFRRERRGEYHAPSCLAPAVGVDWPAHGLPVRADRERFIPPRRDPARTAVPGSIQEARALAGARQARRLRGSGRPRHRVRRGAQRSQGTADLICSDGTVLRLPSNVVCRIRLPLRSEEATWPDAIEDGRFVFLAGYFAPGAGLSLTEHSPGLSRSSSSGPWKECGPEIRRSCDARHCDRRHHPHDDWHTIRLARDLIAAPPLELWPQQVARVPFPKTWCRGCCSP